MAESKRVAFTTLGCKVNQYDTEAMMASFRRAGYQIVDFQEPADFYIVNTCTVTGRGAAKSRQLIRNAIRRSPLSVVAVAGCYTQTDPDEVAAIPGVSLIIGNQDRHQVVELCEQAANSPEPIRAVNNIWKAREFEEMPVDSFRGHTRAVVKIQEGCNIFCTFCIIPYARGTPRSRRPESVIEEVTRLAEEGFREVVLTGIHLGSYGKDYKYEFTLAQVVEKMAAVEGIDRIRLSSLEPKHVTPHLMDLLQHNPKVCRHLHLSLQSGSQTVLERMKRAYTAGEFREVVQELRRRTPELGLTTDVIVGFPGESEAEHQESMAFIREMGFSRLHVFPFSPRKGTPAATMPDQVTKAVKERRTHEMIELGRELALAFAQRFQGQALQVLAEEEADTDPGWLEGYTDNYIRVRLPGGEELKNCIIPVRITSVEEDACLGEMNGYPVGPSRQVTRAAELSVMQPVVLARDLGIAPDMPTGEDDTAE
ncbi:MAG TPA: tRNA (N(6)-L-threonylcarbamoyladenosine(37)-C(2))-methylthiotransferase MtaB [Symbiobacteriaceae bacterium]|nr:tRNA (N(6)-L-threonylcarbamoyladenosine(37)-C(2))-methylthiotransferase MtaB [Symbiobacteriaceae bacterium]